MATTRKIRFAEFLREVTLAQHEVSYNDLTPKVKFDENGNEIPFQTTKLKLKAADFYNILTPYVQPRFAEQLKAVIPLAAYLVLFQLFILRQTVDDSWVITAGLFAVIVGLMFFMEGLKLGLMPFGETIGNTLPKKSPLPVVLLIAFLLGVFVTFAEPAIGALKQAGSIVDVEKAPFLYALLNQWTDTLVYCVGAGVGLAAVLGTMRFLYAWSLKPMIYLSLVATLGLTVSIMVDPEMSKILGLAWDCGAVTTGPVTVPLVLSLGIGVASAAGKGNNSLSGFGIVTLASLFPIIAVMSLAWYVAMNTDPAAIIAAAKAGGGVTTAAAQSELAQFFSTTPGAEIKGGVQAIVPLVIFLVIVMKGVLREKIRNAGMLAYGIFLAVVGMVIFNVGLTYGLSKLGEQSGSIVPAAFTALESVAGSPLYFYSLGIFIAFGFAWFLGFGATLAEPALNALGMTVQNLTNGAFKKSLLMYSVSFGVACGIGLGVLKIIFNIPIAYFLLPGYGLAIILTWLSTEEFVNVAWDSAGVTTGPVTVPLVLAMGLGFGNAVGALDGFGILSMASICPILSVMTCGIFIQWRMRQSKLKEAV